MASPKTKFLPYLALLTGIFSLSFSALFVRWADAPGTVTTFYRMLIGTLIYLPFFLSQPKEKRVKATRWIWLPIIGGLLSGIDHALWGAAIDNTRVSNVVILNNTAPVWVAIAATLLWREKHKLGFWLGLALTMGGVFAVFGSDLIIAPEYLKGNLLAIFSSFFFAAYFLLTQKGREHYSTLTYTFIISLMCSLTLLTVNGIQRLPISGYTPQTYLIFLVAGLVAQVIGYFSLGFALGHLPASIVAPSILAQPVISSFLAVPLAGESLTTGLLTGGAAVLCGIYLINRDRERIQQHRVFQPQNP